MELTSPTVQPGLNEKVYTASAKVNVKYDPSNMEYNHTVNITVSVGGDSYTTPYGIADYTFMAVGMSKAGELLKIAVTEFEFFPAGQESPWQSLGMCQYTDDVVMSNCTEEAETCTYAVEILEHKEKPGLFRLKNPYGEAFPVAKTVLLAIIGNDLYNASWSSAFKVENNLYK